MTTPITEGTRLVAYLRDSGGAGQELSIIQQEKAVGEWAKRNHVIITRIFKDEARSGLSIASRDQFQSMMDYFMGNIPETGLVIWEFSRISRDFDDFAYYVADLRRRNYSIYSINDDIPNSLDGRLLETILSWKNAKYSEDLRKSVRRGLRYVMLTHHAWFGRVPIGFIAVPKTIGTHRDGTPRIIHYLELDPNTAPLVRRAYDMRSAGATFREIQNELQLVKWMETYKKLLSSALYIGIYRNGDWEIRDYCPSIVEADVWEAVQKINEERRARQGFNHPRTLRSNFLLSGLAHCSYCGYSITGHVVHGKNNIYKYYRCHGKNKFYGECPGLFMRKDVLEKRVIEVVKNLLLDRKMLDQLHQEIIRQSTLNTDEYNMKISRLKNELAEVNKAIARLVSAIKDAGHSKSLLNSLAELEDKKIQLDTELSRISMPKSPIDINMDKIVSYINNELENSDPIKLAQVLRNIVVDIRVFKDDEIHGEIECRLPIEGSRTVIMPI